MQPLVEDEERYTASWVNLFLARGSSSPLPTTGKVDGAGERNNGGPRYIHPYVYGMEGKMGDNMIITNAVTVVQIG